MKKTTENSRTLIKSKMIFRFKKRTKEYQGFGTTVDPTETTTTYTTTTGIF